ncbi:hypothetical protein G6O69_31865 [Pseudenhygromyxa sp. WMMC2535]|uniref:hypothetical protein n=1 Tax=Pseudenhygromyxa sp. WMMC2535 TaxID=2712867 RepID=UPI0015554436|nr:hypothetical protein [Pseudenhygromyxa sp. WMMC2535]NVB42464.1 hypothetical protein [Pseudenhygromyxa sp. WMMC2535]
MPDSQHLVIITSFVAMLGFAGVALWLGLRVRALQRSRNAPPEPLEPAPPERATGPRARSVDRTEVVRVVPPPKPPAAASPEGEDATEFVAPPPGAARDADAPQRQHSTGARAEHEEDSTEFVDPALLPAAGAEGEDATEFIDPARLPATGGEGEDATEFIDPARLPATGGEGEDATEFISPAQLPATKGEDATEFIKHPAQRSAAEGEDATVFLEPPASPEGEDATVFIRPPASPEAEDATEFIKPPAQLPDAPRDDTTARVPQLQATATASLFAPPSLPPSVFESTPAPTSTPAPLSPAHREPATALDGPDLDATATSTDAARPAADPIDEHIRLGAEALSALHRSLGEGRSSATSTSTYSAWEGHHGVLGCEDPQTLIERLEPLEDADPRAIVIVLALLDSERWEPHQQLPALVEGLSPALRTLALRTLASWDAPQASAIFMAGLRASEGKPSWAEWLVLAEAFEEPPPSELVARALATSSAALRCAGLRLLARPEVTAALPSAKGSLSTALFDADPEVRGQAIETALVCDNQTAWTLCKQLALNPSYPRITALFAGLGAQAEVEGLAASLGAPTPTSLRALSHSGYPCAIERCLSAAADPELASPALDGFAEQTGWPDPGGELDARRAAAERWWGEHRSRFDSARRYLDGAPRTLSQLLDVLARTPDGPLREAACRELRVRSRGALAPYPHLSPDAWLRELDGLRGHPAAQTLDLEAAYAS